MKWLLTVLLLVSFSASAKDYILYPNKGEVLEVRCDVPGSGLKSRAHTKQIQVNGDVLKFTVTVGSGVFDAGNEVLVSLHYCMVRSTKK